MLSTSKLKTWALRVVVFVTAVALGAVGTLAVVLVMVLVTTDLSVTAFIHLGLLAPIVMFCGAVGLLVAVRRSHGRAPHRRDALVGGALLLLFAVPVTAWAAWPRPGFDAAAFRQATAARDYDVVEDQALRAIDRRVLIGRTKDEVRALLGSPHQAVRTEWRWSVGMIGDFLGPGDGGSLYVQFDPRTQRVESAEVR